ncbi:adenine deaminase C-terminal domain-containing protein [Clostridium ganghwense]|uniref:Adenine deaminase n=1 Tax=Clostridium ganghwense TaxID=312089 RepID=A0ABT4CK80_9CLOT|nr:adenine deaminase C-terminal domain-containing protein [Clostridium ganghwense]MCY6369462.1 amidohydrolase family protein [Clostridium ganghwense]
MEIDLLIKNAFIYNTYFKKFINSNAAVLGDKFLHIGKDCIDELKPKKVIDAEGMYVIPGLIDIHMHIESSMTTPINFTQAAVQYGVTTIVADPHEIANVFGTEGIEAMIKCSNVDAVDIFYGIPSCVPSTSKYLETTGGSIGLEEVLKLIKSYDMCCLGEVMNFKGLISEDESLIKSIIQLIKKEKPFMKIEGHCPKITGLDLSKFIYGGVDSDHTQQTPELLKEKIENGMFIEIQEKSLTEENIKFLIENNLYEHFCLVTDDVMIDKLVCGHLNILIKKAVELGMSVENAIYVSTYTSARRMGFSDRGAIAPGKKADFILLSDINKFDIKSVYKDGKEVFNGKVNYTQHDRCFPEHFYNSLDVDYVNEDYFRVPSMVYAGEVNCRAMKINSNTTFTDEVKVVLNSREGELEWQNSECCLVSVLNRYTGQKNKSFGLACGNVIKNGAVAATYAHDQHNLIVMGRNAEDMAVAVNWIIENNGGYCVVKDGKIEAGVELPVGGILSEERIDVLADKLKRVREALQDLGYKHMNEIMSFSTLSLPVSPALKITDKGLIDVKKQEIVSLFY